MGLLKKREPADDADLPTGPLSEAEVLELRRIIQEEKYAKWFWASFRQWALWIAGGVTMVVTFRENIKAIFLWFVK